MQVNLVHLIDRLQAKYGVELCFSGISLHYFFQKEVVVNKITIKRNCNSNEVIMEIINFGFVVNTVDISYKFEGGTQTIKKLVITFFDGEYLNG